MDDQLRAAVVRIQNAPAAFAADDRSGVTDLAARLRVGRGAVDDHLDLGTRDGLPDAPAVGDHREDARRRAERVVADELDGRDLRGEALIEARRRAVLVRPEGRARARAHAL